MTDRGDPGLPGADGGGTAGARHGRARPAGLAALLLAFLGLAACGGDAGTEVAASPTRLLVLSPTSGMDSVVIGERTDPPLGVQVEGTLGEPVEGVPVRFLLAGGPGRVFPNLAVSNRKGIAEATFEAGSEFGSSRIRVDVPSASNVSPAEFRIVTLPSDTLVLEKLEGDGQEAEFGTQLPRAFRIRVFTPGSTPAGGVPVSWAIEGESPEGFRFSSDTSYTDAEGRTETLLTVGSTAGEFRIRAHAGGGAVTDTVRFRISAVPRYTGPITIDSVQPLPLRAGEEATLFGAGFPNDPATVAVRVEGTEADVLASSLSRVRVRIPEFADRCLPARSVGVRAFVEGEPSNGAMAALRPRQDALALEPGQARTLAGAAEVDCVRLSATREGRRYYATAGTASRAAGAVLPLRLMLRTGEGEPTATARPAAALTDRGDRLAEAEEAVRELATPELRLRLRARRELGARRIGARPYRPRPVRAPAEARRATSGDLLAFNFPVGSDLTIRCGEPGRRIGAVVRATGDAVLFAQDTLAPAGGFTDAEWGTLLERYERVVIPTDTAYFGAPADIDGNGRIIVLVTPEVNRLSPPGSAARIGGFFNPLDLADSGDPEGGGVQGPGGEICPASNEAEILYLAAPDPGGRFGDPISAPRAMRNALGTGAHELQHLLSAEQRVILGNGDLGQDLEEVWLGEGLSHLAEEVVGLRLMDQDPGDNLGFDRILSDREMLDVFNTFHGANFQRLALFMQDPTGAPILSDTDPGGVRGLQMRGFAWAFVRWLADQRGDGDEARLVRRLSTGGSGRLTGVDNVESAVGARWSELVADFHAALALDDAEVSDPPSRLRFTTWNLPSVFEGLHENVSAGRNFPVPFPLALTRLPFEPATVDFEAQASTSAFFVLEGARDLPAVSLRLTSQSGGGLSGDSPYLTVVRLR